MAGLTHGASAAETASAPGAALNPSASEPDATEDAEDRLAALFDAAAGPGSGRKRAALEALWDALPGGGVPGGRPRFWAAALAGVLARGAGGAELGPTLAGFLGAALAGSAAPEPVLRLAMARLSHPRPGLPPALRIEILAALRHGVPKDGGARDPDGPRAAGTAAAPPSGQVRETPAGRDARSGGRPVRACDAPPAGRAAPGPATQSHRLTARAGLVLFHPFLVLLFDRLGLRADRTRLSPEGLPRAAALLAALAGHQREGPLDPLERLLLALPDGVEPDEARLAPAETALVESLLQSVIAQWRRLGQTSPEGLRETFVRRRGLIERRDPDPPRLFVDKGPFDMLLDGLPWQLTQVAMPWMPLPLAVFWREPRD